MPRKIAHTIVRGGVYYVNLKVPQDLLHYDEWEGKSKIVESLATKDYREASELAPIRVGQLKQRFKELRMVASQSPDIATGVNTSDVSNEERSNDCVFFDVEDPIAYAEELAERFFLQQLKEIESEMEEAYSRGDEEGLDIIVSDARHEIELYGGGMNTLGVDAAKEVVNGVDILRAYLEQQDLLFTDEGLNLVKATHDRFRRAVLEVARRTDRRYNDILTLGNGGLVTKSAWETAFDSLFMNLSPYKKRGGIAGANVNELIDGIAEKLQPLATQNTVIPEVTVRELCEAYLEDQKDNNNREKSIKSARSATIMVRAVLGDETQLHTVDGDSIKELIDFHSSLPKGLRVGDDPIAYKLKVQNILEKGVEYEEQSSTTYENKWILVTAIFNYAAANKDFKLAMPESPLKNKKLGNYFRNMTPRGKKRGVTEFRVDELNRLFRQPLYTGHAPLDEHAGWKRAGRELDRQSGRYWAPLFMLFHGCRLNEVAQLMPQDVNLDAEIPYVRISPFFGTEGEEPTPKNLKNKNSNRIVPLHPELIKCGFLEFVSMRLDEGAIWLFPEWVHTSVKEWKVGERLPELKGKHSDLASDHCLKLYANIIDDDRNPRPNSHSFRHGVMTVFHIQNAPERVAEKILGWDNERPSMSKGYGIKECKALFPYVEKVGFEGLDISHLYTSVIK